MLDRREAFKVAFLLRCAEAGLTLEETCSLVKQAAFSLKDVPGVGLFSEAGRSIIKGVSDLAFKTVIPSALKATTLAMIGVPLVAGGTAGWALARARGMNDAEPEEYQLSERIAALRNAATRARQSKKLHDEREREKLRGRRTPALI